MRSSAVLYRGKFASISNTYNVHNIDASTNLIVGPDIMAESSIVYIPETHPMFNINVITIAIFNLYKGYDSVYVRELDRKLAREISEMQRS